MSVNTKVNGELVKSAGLYSVTKPIGMADIYSTEEKEVGLWIDNRPLYQKTIELGTLPNNTTKNVEHNISSLDTVVAFEGFYKNPTTNSIIPLSFTHRSTINQQIQLSVNQTYVSIITAVDETALTECYVTIQYVKTTDTPWSGKFVPQGYGYVSSGDIYSLEERQVGVWTDGKPLYQKTVDCGTLPNNTTKTVAHGISNIDTIVNAYGHAKATANQTPIPFVNNTSAGSQVALFADATNITLRTSEDKSPYTSAYVTLQYTKTTDIAGSGEYVPSGDKAVHYSTEEEVIGTFLGETLYRKTFVFNSAIQCASQSWTVLTGATVNNVSKIINSFTEDDNGTLFIPTGTNMTNNTFGVLFTRNSAINVKTFTVEYTKTS